MMRMFFKGKFIISILLLFIVASFSVTFAYWTSNVQGSSSTGNGSVGVGLWVPPGFVGIAQEEGNGMIRLDQIGTTVGSTFYPLTGQLYIQMTDIDLSGSFIPIGLSSQTPFGGEYHGNGFSISGLNINITQSSGSSVYAGLFYQNAGIISGVSLINVSVSVNKSLAGAGTDEIHVGGIAGRNTGDIFNSYVSGSVSGTATRTTSGNGNETVTTRAFVGGIAGSNTGKIGVSYSNADISSNTIASANTNNKDLYGYSYAGGLVGINQSPGTINKTYATGTITAESRITNTGNKPQQANANSYAGGLVGHNDSASVSNSFATGDVEARTQTSATGVANRYYGYINGLGISTNSLRLNTQTISGFVITPGASGNQIPNNLDNTVQSVAIEYLRSESDITGSLSWSVNDWTFNSTFYPRLKRNKY